MSVNSFEKIQKHYKKGQFVGDLFVLSLLFSKIVLQNEFCFLHCNQCIKTLHLSYQTALSEDFQFHSFKGGPFDLGGSERHHKGMDWTNTVFK